MEACEQVQRGPLKLKGVTELGVTKQKKKKKDKDKARLLEAMGTSKKNEEEERRGLDKRTPAQAAFEKRQEKRQMERVLKKASRTHKQRGEDFSRHLDARTEHCNFPKSAGAGSRPAPGTGGIEEEQTATSRLCLGPWYLLETFLRTHPCVFC